MKREIAMIAFVLLGMGMTASAQFGKKINLGKALQAGKDVVSAVTLSDADIANMSKEYMVCLLYTSFLSGFQFNNRPFLFS